MRIELLTHVAGNGVMVAVGHLDDRAARASAGAGSASHCRAGSGTRIAEVTELPTGGALNQLGVLLEEAIRCMPSSWQ